MLVIGDVFAVVAVLVGVFFTGYATILGLCFTFSRNVGHSSAQLASRGPKAFWMGLLAGLPISLVLVAMAGNPLPIVKVLGIWGILVVLAIAMMGIGGLAQVLAGRIRETDESMTPFAALSRATFIIVASMIFPLVGWLLVTPMLFLVGFGAGLQSFLPVRAPKPVQPSEVI